MYKVVQYKVCGQRTGIADQKYFNTEHEARVYARGTSKNKDILWCTVYRTSTMRIITVYQLGLQLTSKAGPQGNIYYVGEPI